MSDQLAQAQRRIAQLESQLASANGQVVSMQQALRATQEQLRQADAIRNTEVESLRLDLKEAQQRLLDSATSRISQVEVDALHAEINAYKADNTVFLEALTACADCTKSQAQQIAAKALGQSVE
jgi:hypothetical protein